MDSNRRHAIVAGALFIIAAVTAVIAVVLYNPVLSDAGYVTTDPGHDGRIVTGAVLELVLAGSVVGISLAMYPYLRKFHVGVALGYICFRLFEAVLIVVGLIGLLSVVTLRQEFAAAGAAASDASAYLASSRLLVAVHDWTFMLGPNFMLGISTMLCSSTLFRLRLVPRVIAGTGMIGAVLVFIAALLEMYGVVEQSAGWGAVLAVPVALYEMSLAVWLLVRGFDKSRLTALASR